MQGKREILSLHLGLDTPHPAYLIVVNDSRSQECYLVRIVRLCGGILTFGEQMSLCKTSR
jgi:hypothetical protein